MRFKQVQLFQLDKTAKFSLASLIEKLSVFSFTPCLPSFPDSIGWVSPVDEEDAPLARAFNGYIMFCLQVEEKIMPATVINQSLVEAVKELEISQARKLRSKEKMALKDDIIVTMLPRAFSRLTRVYAYIDLNRHWLVLGTANAKLSEKFLLMFKKSIAEEIEPVRVTDVSSRLTHWLKTQQYPTNFSIEKACVLHDPQQESRLIRAQEQDLFAPSMQSLLKDGCEVKQLALCWQDRVKFVLADDFILRGISCQDEIKEAINNMEAETKQQRFDADFLIMTDVVSGMLVDLLDEFGAEAKAKKPSEDSIKYAQTA